MYGASTLILYVIWSLQPVILRIVLLVSAALIARVHFFVPVWFCKFKLRLRHVYTGLGCHRDASGPLNQTRAFFHSAGLRNGVRRRTSY